MGTDSIRPAAVAGSWYPATAGALTRDVDAYLDDVDAAVLPAGRVEAVIAPHAGLMFSGPVGAYAYKTAAASGPYDAAILAGPSHFVAFDGVALYPAGAFATPLGSARIDEALARELAEASPIVQPDAAAFQTFITTVICRPHLAHLPDPALREAFVQDLTKQASRDNPPFELDYWRLNIEARKPN